MTITTKENLHLGPSVPDMGNHPLQDRYDLFSIRPLTRAKDGRDQFPTFSFVDVKGQIAGLIIVAIEHGQLLMAVGGIVRGIRIKNNGLRRTIIGIKETVQKGLGYPIQVRSGDRVLQPGHRRLTGQSIPRDRQPLTGRFQDRIMPELIAIIGILIATGNLKNPLPQQFLMGVVCIALRTPAKRLIRPMPLSTSRRNITPASLVRLPPSNSAVTFLPEIVAKGRVICISLSMAVSFLRSVWVVSITLI